MPATPMNEAAERYSPEMADAFQPTDIERPATKKSLEVMEVLAERKPIQTVTTTVMNGELKIQGSTPSMKARGSREAMAQRASVSDFTCLTSSSSSQMDRRMKIHETVQTSGMHSTPSRSQLSVKPATR